MISPLELAANGVNALSILFAGRNSAHTWWVGIVGCCLFGLLFYENQLYADVVLQAFFVVTSALGWWHWLRGRQGQALPVRYAHAPAFARQSLAALACACAYAYWLYRNTDAYQPLADSVVLAGSVLGQFLLMGRRVEAWYCWVAVNTIAAPLYASRGLYLTSLMYTAFWVNALLACRHWRHLAAAETR